MWTFSKLEPQMSQPRRKYKILRKNPHSDHPGFRQPTPEEQAAFDEMWAEYYRPLPPEYEQVFAELWEEWRSPPKEVKPVDGRTFDLKSGISSPASEATANPSTISSTGNLAEALLTAERT